MGIETLDEQMADPSRVERVAIHQPPYLAWFGLIDKIARCDRFVILDTVTYNARAFQHRTLYSTDEGPKYLSLAVNSKGHRSELRTIRNMRLSDPSRPAKHYETLRHRYGKRPGWRVVGPALNEIMHREHHSLLELNVALLSLTLRMFAIETPCILASELAHAGTKTDLMLSLTLAAGGSVYLSGGGARSYLDESIFQAACVGLLYQEFVHPLFEQSHGGAFRPGCLALEWILEHPDTAVGAFHEQLRTRGSPRPRLHIPA